MNLYHYFYSITFILLHAPCCTITSSFTWGGYTPSILFSESLDGGWQSKIYTKVRYMKSRNMLYTIIKAQIGSLFCVYIYYIYLV